MGAAPPVACGAGGWDERVVVAGLDEEQSGHDHQQHDGQLDRDEDEVDLRGDLDPDADDGGEDQHDGRGDQVVALAVGPARDRDPRLAHDVREVRRPAHRHRAGAQGQLQDQVPADDPGDELAQACVGERVGRTSHRHRARELRVAERRQRTREAREDERQRHRRPGLLTRRLAREHEDPGADDHPDPEDGQLDRPELLAELVLGLLGVGDRLLDGLRAREVQLFACPRGRKRSEVTLRPQSPVNA